MGDRPQKKTDIWGQTSRETDLYREQTSVETDIMGKTSRGTDLYRDRLQWGTDLKKIKKVKRY
jgi:hypothetical protein